MIFGAPRPTTSAAAYQMPHQLDLNSMASTYRVPIAFAAPLHILWFPSRHGDPPEVFERIMTEALSACDALQPWATGMPLWDRCVKVEHTQAETVFMILVRVPDADEALPSGAKAAMSLVFQALTDLSFREHDFWILRQEVQKVDDLVVHRPMPASLPDVVSVLSDSATVGAAAVVGREIVKQTGETIREKIRQNGQQPSADQKSKRGKKK